MVVPILLAICRRAPRLQSSSTGTPCWHCLDEGAENRVDGFRRRENLGNIRVKHDYHLAFVHLPREPVGASLAVVEVVFRPQFIRRKCLKMPQNPRRTLHALLGGNLILSIIE